jgi:type II secretory pathway component PulJ
MTLLEVVVAAAVMSMVIGALSLLVGASVRSKTIVAVRSSDTQTARQTLEWMSERLRNAGLNVLPSAQLQVRCRDMVVAQDTSLRPQRDRVYVSGEIFNSNTTAGDEVITLGYRLQNGVLIEERSSCAGAWVPATSGISDPHVTVTDLAFHYFDRVGDEVAVPTTDVDAIRSIRLISVSLTVQAVQGRSGTQTQTFTRMIMLRNPRPDTNAWLSPRETYP